MLVNYLKISLRNLRKHKLFSLTNIIGLSIGVLCCLLIMMYVQHEMSYEEWNPKAERIVRPYGDINFGGNLMRMAVTGAIIAPESAEVIPEIEDWCRIRDYGSFLVREENTNQVNIQVEDVLSVDSSFFNLFPLPMVEGDPQRCLQEPNTLVISEDLANKLFGGTKSVVGKNLLLSDRDSWTITGIYKDIPRNTHFKADILRSLNGNEEIANSPPFWAANNNFHSYLLLREGTDFQKFQKKFETLAREKVSITARTLLGMSLEDFEKTGQHARYLVQQMKDIHLKSNLQVELEANGDIRYIWIFSFVALFVLMIACINFMNLTTAKSVQRTKEIAVRKVLGSKRKQLINQFLSEAMVMTFLAFVLAFLIAWIIKPSYLHITGVALNLPWSDPLFLLIIIGSVILVGLMAGSYPAFFLSAYKPLDIIRGSATGGKASRDQSLRNILVVFQFTVATALIIGSFVIYQQLQFMQHKKLGFKQEQILVVDNTYTLGNNIESFKKEILQDPMVKSVSISSYLPIPSSRSNSTYSKGRELREDLAINMAEWRVDYDYANTYDLKLKEGRFFDEAYGQDSNAVVLNEAAIRILGFEQPIGMKIYGAHDVQGKPTPDDYKEYTIIGVLQDFHYESLRQEIGALGMFLGRSTGKVSVAFQSESTDRIISQLENIWQKMAPKQPFSYRFVDETFGKMYEAEKRVGTITLIFATLAILVSCLGLFGLSTFVVEQRSKEIGIRKVLGASVSNIVALLSRQFLILVGLGIIIAIPLTWYFISGWLENFAYRISIRWTVLLVAAILSLLIAFFTVGSQSLKAAIRNPVKALRSE
ncbi:MAG: ABC transporter permease [Saprospiraceae bacterium]|nr:ABC transporter permease [Saprospiraceae bacterium]